jgi:leucine dehydrogenase
MTLFSHPEFRAHEGVYFAHDAASGLKAIVAIHNTTRGPAVGGCRMWPYADEAAAITDALRLSRGMTYKSALAELPFGGGKSVIIGNSARDKTPELLRAMGRAVERLGGAYVIAEDVGTTVFDMDTVATATKHVACTSEGSGNPSPYTALGVLCGIEAAVQYKLNRNAGDLDGVRVAVQGLGQVGYALCRSLKELGARLFVSDIAADRVARASAEFGATAVAPEAIYDADADVFAPCALGGILDERTIARLKARIVAGAANNQLAEDRHGALLTERGILYAPDYAINAGGVIEIAFAKQGDAAIRRRVEGIRATLLEIFGRADAEHAPTHRIADRMAEERFRQAA